MTPTTTQISNILKWDYSLIIPKYKIVTVPTDNDKNSIIMYVFDFGHSTIGIT